MLACGTVGAVAGVGPGSVADDCPGGIVGGGLEASGCVGCTASVLLPVAGSVLCAGGTDWDGMSPRINGPICPLKY